MFEKEDAMTATESEVKALLDRWSGATRNKDIDRLMSLYAPESVYFDIVPPLRFTGAEEIRRNFLRWFDTWQSSIGVEIRDLHILVSADVASTFMLHRTSGTLKDGREVDYWVRATVCCQRSDQGWSIKHEHISTPVDLKTGRVITGLVP
jgi:ketosteroid isomerase-like protein